MYSWRPFLYLSNLLPWGQSKHLNDSNNSATYLHRDSTFFGRVLPLWQHGE